MPPLDDNLDQAFSLQSAQVYARRGRADIGNYGEFGAGSRAIVHKAIEHARTRWFADRRRDACSARVHLEFNIHTLRLNEVL
jgi:hypothetical protein